MIPIFHGKISASSWLNKKPRRTGGPEIIIFCANCFLNWVWREGRGERERKRERNNPFGIIICLPVRLKLFIREYNTVTHSVTWTRVVFITFPMWARKIIKRINTIRQLKISIFIYKFACRDWRYIFLKIDTGWCANEFSSRWYLLHENTSIYIETKLWLMQKLNCV